MTLWVKIKTIVPSGDETITCHAVNADTGVVLWVRPDNGTFRIELEVVVGIDSNGDIVRHVPLLQICTSQEEADQKVDDFLTALKAGETLFAI